MQQILLVEDSEEYRKIVLRALGHHKVTCATTVDEAAICLRGQRFDLILLDLRLPKKDGYSLLSELQSNLDEDPIPVICLTGKQEISDKVTAFSLGADDYIVKPFDPIELKARVDAKLAKKRETTERASARAIGDLTIDLSTHRVALKTEDGKKEIALTQTEFKLLCCLTKHPDQVYTRDQLLIAAWGEDASVLDRVVDVHICALRKKMGRYSSCIKAVPGTGYKFSLHGTNNGMGRKPTD